MDEEFLNEIWAQFEVEAVEHSKDSEDILLATANNTLSKDDIDKLFRNFHSLKGLTGSIGMSKTESLTHLAEDLISEIRNGVLEFDDNLRGILLKFIDVLNAVLQKSIKDRAEVIPRNFGLCKKELERILQNKSRKIKKTNLIVENESFVDEKFSDSDTMDAERFTLVSSASLDDLFQKSGTLVSRANALKRVFEQSEGIRDNDYASGILDKLVNDIQILNGRVTDLRLISVNSLVRRLKRATIDISSQLNKKVKLNVIGDNERADRKIVRNLADPLMHMIRNSIDHGIESNKERKNKGIGKIDLSFKKEADKLIVNLSDDGRGLDKKKILETAVKKNIIDKQNVKQVSDRDVFSLIFKPGFSTALNVSSTSGRGVGMDVVEKNIAVLGGKVEVNSEHNKGTNFSLVIPGAVSTEECIILKDLPTFYAVPSRSIQWIKNKSELETDIVSGLEHVRFKKSQIPIQDLNSLLSFPLDTSKGLVEKIILLSLSDKAIAISYSGNFIYDEFVFEQPDKLIANLPLVSGTTVDDDQNIIFRLNVENLFNFDTSET